jgi:alkylated DNA repair dioxygenase AlkB
VSARRPTRAPRRRTAPARTPAAGFDAPRLQAAPFGRALPRGLAYDPRFVSEDDRAALLAWLGSIRPIWEMRYSAHHPPPPGKSQRRLLRPVYWLGNWQFACLDYYRPPRGVENRSVRAEPFPPVLARLAARAEAVARLACDARDIPAGWRLDTCLVNYYGASTAGGRRVDTARVGEHRDFEPGPVASISLGERAFFQFVAPSRPGSPGEVILDQWLDDGSLQVFGGPRWKDRLFHRVQRVDRREGHSFPLAVDGFEARRVNLTLRHVPDRHVVRYSDLPDGDAEDVRDYMEELARGSAFFRKELAARRREG